LCGRHAGWTGNALPCGVQDFGAQPGNVVYCFARVFAPSGFRDTVYVHWWEEWRGGGEDQGRARLDISGGRGEGLRALARERNYPPGRWSNGERNFSVERL
jgi:hypothetical protein